MKRTDALTPRQEDLLSAAWRHTGDAKALLAEAKEHPASPDQAWHLAGFGLECIRKACLFERWGDKALGHELSGSASALLDFLLALDAHAWRYRLLREWEQEESLVKEWTPESRYERTGTRSQADAQRLVDFTREKVKVATMLLWADGRLTDPDI